MKGTELIKFIKDYMKKHNEDPNIIILREGYFTDKNIYVHKYGEFPDQKVKKGIIIW